MCPLGNSPLWKKQMDFTSFIGRSTSTTHEATETSTAAIVDDQEAHDDNQSHANEYRSVIKVFSKSKFSNHFKESTS